MLRKIIFSLILPLMICATSYSAVVLSIPKASGDIVFDGLPNEEGWQIAEILPLVTQQPIFGENPSETTEIMVVHDDEYLYVAGRLYDKEPDKILANSFKRDALIGNTDWFGFIIDSFNDKQNGLGFFTNPNGLRLDVNIVNDAYGREPINVSWNAFWDVATKTTDEGWFVEIRVPFSSIPFQVIDGKVTMGLIAWRYIARKNEVDIYPAIGTEFGEWSGWKPSLAQEIELTNVQRKKPLYIAPYVIGGYNQEALEHDPPEKGYYTEEESKFDVGLDVKYGLTDNLNLDITFNTDFAQVEVDDEQVNLTRFSLFFPEKRLFFQERAGIFSFGFGRRDQLFYSRRIGIYDDEEPVRIYGGARMVGRIGDLDVGLITMQTASIDTLNSLNHSVIRFKKQIINQNSDIGLLVTNQADLDGFYNTNIGLDSRINVSNNDFLSIKYAQTIASDVDAGPIDPDAARWFISFVNQSSVGWIYSNSLSKSGKYFNPSLGFMQRENFYRWGHRFGYGWLPGDKSFIQTHSINWRGSWFRNNEIGETDSYSGGPSWRFTAKKGYTGGITLEYNFENPQEAFDISDNIIIQPGKYGFYNAELEFGSSFNKPFYAIYNLQYGSFYGGSKFSFAFNPYWTASSHLELSANYILNHISLPDISETLHIARVKGQYMFNTKVSLSSFIQYNSLDKAFVMNIRMRYNPQEGNDLYLVYNDDINTSRLVNDIRKPLSNQRSVLLKYTYTFRM